MSRKISIQNYDFVKVPPAANWINGQWIPGSGPTLDVINPRYGRVMSHVPMSLAKDVQKAVDAAQNAFPGWRETPIKERVQVLYRLKNLFLRDLDDLSWMISHENGKAFAQAKASVKKAIEGIEYGISIPNMIQNGILEVSRGVHCSVNYEPLGVCLGITPFNFPIMVPFWMLPQAIVAGNTFILKPSEKIPLSISMVAELFQEAGLPNGVFNIVHGQKEAVNALLEDPRIKAAAFVGSTKIAKLLYAKGAQTGRRMLCLGGAKNHLIIVPDADPEITAQNVTSSFTGGAGQRCMAASVVIAVGDSDHLIQAIVDKASQLVTGRDMGAIIRKESLDRIVGYIDDAEARGAKVILDGRKVKVPNAEHGYWVGPTIIDHVTPEMPAAREEIFGPVLSIIRVKTLDEAIAIENSSPYGNAASIYTQSGHVARYVTKRVEAGMNGVNIGVPVPREPFSFGGWNESKFGHGDITGYDGYRFWTRPRKITVKWALQKDSNWMS